MAENSRVTSPDAPATADSNRTPVRRRNGELQACEPCRMRKLRCDHGYPVCGRCIKRKHIDSCVYHPAPLTKKPKTAAQISKPSDAPPRTQRQIPTPPLTVEPSAPPTQTPLARVASEPLNVGSTPANHVSSSHVSVEQLSADQGRHGYVGNSGFTAVVAEIHASLGDSSQEIGSVHFSEPVPDDKVKRGIENIIGLRDFKLASQLVQRQLNLISGYIIFEPIYKVWLDGLNFFFSISGYDVTDDADVIDLSRMVWKNTLRPLTVRDGSVSAREWALEATGDNLRWETIGLIFSTARIMSRLLRPWDPIFAGRDRTDFLKMADRIVESCLQLSKECGHPNELLLCLAYEHCFSMRKIKGEVSFDTWRAMSECCDYAIALGLHQEKKTDSRTPFFLCELRKRLFSDVFSFEKFQSTHMGRPPRLSYRHSAFQIPLDLSDEDACATGERLSDALSQVDEKGWSLKQKVNRISWRRCWQLMCPVREDILELSTQVSNVDLDRRVPEIRVRIQEAYDFIPDWFPKDPIAIEQQIRGVAPWTLTIPRLEWRPLDSDMFFSVQTVMFHTEFLLERAIYNRRKTDPTALLLAARNLLNVLLRIYSLRDYMQEFISDMNTWLIFYGIPCAGVIAVETLKRDQSFDYAPNVLPRSEVIQSLAVLISALETIGPEEGGNYLSCQHGLTALKRILEKILSPKPPIAEMNQGNEQALLTSFPPEFATHTDADFLQWLGNVEWEGDHWFEHNGP
ncbi:hypothetical protein K431DRAFT_283381 [Polychaeton citri CBS 116435]|uniref:Zn(2)-C6 fungal-type domain-containing protein n=1 Tax=Polychaeton citri CBS 116435 TaxID=1314669 RepID=A0A9P4QDC2_9PEZI|nr:hypothetical protein K431DRAFT_283381 [Polychaeton citri CBS 116435]